MEVEFFAGSLNFRIKKLVNPNQKISDELNKVIKQNSILSSQNFNLILCEGNIVDPDETFKKNKLKNGCILMLISGASDESTINENEYTPLQISLKKCITMHSHVNLKNVDLNAFIDRTMTVFKSLKNEYLLIYSYSEDYKNYSLKCYDILKDKSMTKVQKAHSERIFTCSHFLDKYNMRDLLITSAFDKKIKIWNITNNFQVIYEKKPDYYFKENTYLLSENILSDNNKIYLIVSAYEINSSGYDLLYYNTSKKIDWRHFENSRDNTNFLDIFYRNGNPEIIAANLGNVKIYNFQNKKLIKFFHDNNNKLNYLSAIVKNDSVNNKNLIVSAGDGLLRIWDYNNPNNLLQSIKTYLNVWLIGLELINDRYLYAAGADGNIKEFDLKKNFMSRNLNRNNSTDPLFTLRYININGRDFLFSHSHKGLIELWK
jgi:WD40 repeat protein